MSNAKWLDGFTMPNASTGYLYIVDRWNSYQPGFDHGIPESERWMLGRHFGGYRHGNGAWSKHLGCYPTREAAEAEMARLNAPKPKKAVLIDGEIE